MSTVQIKGIEKETLPLDRKSCKVTLLKGCIVHTEMKGLCGHWALCHTILFGKNECWAYLDLWVFRDGMKHWGGKKKNFFRSESWRRYRMQQPRGMWRTSGRGSTDRAAGWLITFRLQWTHTCVEWIEKRIWEIKERMVRKVMIGCRGY